MKDRPELVCVGVQCQEGDRVDKVDVVQVSPRIHIRQEQEQPTGTPEVGWCEYRAGVDSRKIS